MTGFTATEILERLVSFNTVSNQSNLELVDWVVHYLNDQGINVVLDYNEDKTKASLCALIGPPVAGGVVLSGHTDVVPVVGQKWDTDPWKLVEIDGRLYGRGTCDMKGFDAVVLASVPRMINANLKRPVQIVLTRDEEIGCIGAPPMIEKMKSRFPPASAAIIGEPTMMKVVTGHKGGTTVSVHVRGYEVHSSLLHRGVSAVMRSAQIVEWIRKRNEKSANSTPSIEASVFDPPYTTLHVGMISGGTAQNITAKDCKFGMEIRCVPSEHAKQWVDEFTKLVNSVTHEMQETNNEAKVEISQRFEVPPLAQEIEGEAEELARRLTGDNSQHVVSYGTEAGQFQQQYCSSVVCGPGSIVQAHAANEYISIEQLRAGERFVCDLITNLSK